MGVIGFLFWLALCGAAGMFATIRRNRSGIGWFVFAFFLSPLLAFLFLAILRPKESRIILARGGPSATPPPLVHDFGPAGGMRGEI